MARAIPLNELTVFSAINVPVLDFPYQDGAIFLINKPKGWSSFDVVRFLRNRINIKKIGHAGTLDPMAEGLLVLCCGKATKSINQIQEKKKQYTGEITFGASTPSYDAETDIDEEAPYEHITRDKIEQVLENEFSGEIDQVPPMYSALKRKGKRLYKLARKGEKLELYPRKVTIYATRVIDYSPPELTMVVECGKGTYIRSIAHDLGKKLNSRGYLSKLTRDAIGEFRNDDALTIEQLNEIFNT